MKATHFSRAFFFTPIIAFFCVLFFMESCKKDDPVVVGKYTTRIDQLTDSLVTKLTYNGKAAPLPGLIVGIWAPRQDYTYLKSKGYANLASQRPMQVDDLFRIASTTKTFTSILLLQLAEEGFISLDDKIDKYLTGIPNGAVITIRQLLAMQSGLFEVNNDSVIGNIFISDPDHYFSPIELLEAIKRHTTTFSPGERIEYCNSNFIIAGILVEQLTEQSFEKALQTRITQPLGLQNTIFANSRWMPANKPYASGYMFNSNLDYFECTENFNMSVAFTAGAIVSNMDDLKKWVLNLTSGTLISPAMQAQMEDFHPIFEDVLENTEYGLGLMRYKDNYIGHSGDGMGYHSFLARNPEKDITIAIFFNGEYPYPQVIFHELLKILE
ncbi:MAG: beta-lactamase family protein [Bacteroidales bacterium]|nr:beta-lactamase family protein [Bacteroidales bacterium]